MIIWVSSHLHTTQLFNSFNLSLLSKTAIIKIEYHQPGSDATVMIIERAQQMKGKTVYTLLSHPCSKTSLLKHQDDIHTHTHTHTSI